MIILHSYAKINLGLEILERRKDGYHNLLSVMQSVALYDTIKCELLEKKSNEIEIICDYIGVPNDKRNLAWKAVEAIKQYTSLPLDEKVRITIDKKIPPGAGLAGGSGNAAAVLIGLNQLWKLNLSIEDLIALALYLGSDVPFCLEGGMAIARGRGEVLETLIPLNKGYFLIIYPLFSISTAEAYSSLGRSKKTYKPIMMNKIIEELNQGNIPSDFINDFENVTFPKYPILAQIKKLLLNNGAEASLLSGSGASLWGYFENYNIAIKTKDFLSKQFPEMLLWLVEPYNLGVEIV